MLETKAEVTGRLQKEQQEKEQANFNHYYEICRFKGSGFLPLQQAKAIKLSKSDFISQLVFHIAEKNIPTPVLMTNYD